MSQVAGSVVVAIKAVDEASSVFNKIQASMGILGASLSSLGGGFQGLGNVISGFAAGGVVGAAAAGLGQVIQGLQWATKEASANQQAWTDLQAALKLTGGEWDAAKGKINEFASAIQKTTAFSDEMVVGAVQRMATFGMSYQQGMAAVSTAVELAAAKHIDLQTATDLLGKAFMGNTAILSRYGINIDEIKNSMGKGATDAQIYEAVLAQLNEQFGGTAVAQATTYAGTQERLKNAMSDLGEKIGGILVPALASFTEGMIPVVDWLGQGIDKVQAWITAVGKMPEVKAATDAVGVAFQGFQKWLGDVASAAMTELGPALQELWSALKDIFDALAPIGEAFAEIWAAFSDGEGSGNILKDILGLIADNIKLIAAAIKFVAPYIKMLAEAFKVAAEFITPILITIRDVVGGFLSWLHDAFEGFYNFLVGHSLWQDLWNSMVSVVQNFGTLIGAAIQAAFAAWNMIVEGGMMLLQTVLTTGFQLALAAVQTIVEGGMSIIQGLINTVTQSVTSTATAWNDFVKNVQTMTASVKKAIDDLVAMIKTAAGTIQSTWSSTLQAMAAETRSTFNQIVADISAAVDAIIAKLKWAQGAITAHSIWPDMLGSMVDQTKDALRSITGQFDNLLSMPGEFTPEIAANLRGSQSQAAGAVGPLSFSAEIPLTSTITIDGEQIQTIIQRNSIRQTAVQRAAFAG